MTGFFAKFRSGWRLLRARPVLAMVFDVALIIVIMLAIHAWQTRHLPVDQPAPVRMLAALEDGSAGPVSKPGEVGVVYFFAPWCNVCRRSIGNLDDLVATGSLAWASAIALDYRNTQEVRQFVETTGISMPVRLGEVTDATDWKIKAFPTYFVIDSDGRIASRSVGYSTGMGLRLRAWLAE